MTGSVKSRMLVSQHYLNIKTHLLSEQSLLSISVLRICFGIFVMWHAYDKGYRAFIGTTVGGLQFGYPFFSWVEGSPEHAQTLTVLWFFSGLMVSLGFLFRISCPLAFLLTAYSYLISADRYLNHEYMELIFLFLLGIGPANRRLSIDQFIWKFPATFPSYYLTALKLQTEIILIYAGLVKVNSDWLHLQPLSSWLAYRSDKIFFGGIWHETWAVAMGAYGVILLHLVGAPLMLWRRTRLAVFCIYSIFHAINSQIFPIDIFPWMTIACSTIFFDPDWPSRICRRIGKSFSENFVKAWAKGTGDEHLSAVPTSSRTKSCQSAHMAILAFWLLLQALIPMRSLFYPGPVDWNDDGQRFSWRMMLTQRSCPVLTFILYDPNSRHIVIPDIRRLIAQRMRFEICARPDMFLQAAHQILELYVNSGGLSKDTRIHGYVLKAVNYRKPALFIDPKVDLGKEKRHYIYPYSWVIHDRELEPLPPPFGNNTKDFRRPTALQVAAYAGIDVSGEYVCKYRRPPISLEGTDVVCARN